MTRAGFFVGCVCTFCITTSVWHKTDDLDLTFIAFFACWLFIGMTISLCIAIKNK